MVGTYQKWDAGEDRAPEDIFGHVTIVEKFSPSECLLHSDCHVVCASEFQEPCSNRARCHDFTIHPKGRVLKMTVERVFTVFLVCA